MHHPDRHWQPETPLGTASRVTVEIALQHDRTVALATGQGPWLTSRPLSPMSNRGWFSSFMQSNLNLAPAKVQDQERQPLLQRHP